MREGHLVRIEHGGAADFQAAIEPKPDVILLDLGLPDLSGQDVCRAIRDSLGGSQPTIITVTGYRNAEAKARTAKPGLIGT